MRDWPSYKSDLRAVISLYSSLTTQTPVECLVSQVQTNILMAAIQNFEQTKGIISYKFSVPWLTTECVDAVGARRRSQNSMRRSPCTETVLTF